MLSLPLYFPLLSPGNPGHFPDQGGEAGGGFPAGGPSGPDAEEISPDVEPVDAL